MMSHPVSSHLLEVILKVISDDLLLKVIGRSFSGQLIKLAMHGVANFVLQRLLERAKDLLVVSWLIFLRKVVHHKSSSELKFSWINMRQIIHWVSKETYHFFRAALTQIQIIKMKPIIMECRLATVIPNKHILKQRFAWVKEEKNVKWQEVIIKNPRNCSPPGLEVRRRQKPVQWLHNPPLKLNE